MKNAIMKTVHNAINIIRQRAVGLLRNNLFWMYTFFAISAKNIIALFLMYNGESSNVPLLDGLYRIHTVVAYTCFVAILLSIAFLLKGRLKLGFLILMNLIVSILLLVDVLNYRAFGTISSLHMVKQAANLENLSESILSLNRWINMVLFLDFIPLVFLAAKFKNLHRKMKRSVLLFSLLFGMSTLILVFLDYEADTRMKWGAKGQVFMIRISADETITNLSPIGFHFYDVYIYWNDNRKMVLSGQQKNEVAAWLQNKQEVLPDNKYQSMFKGKNLILIQAESLENFVINQKIDGQEITPNLNKMLANSLYFSNFYEQVHEGTSSDAELIANTSVYPIRRGSTFFRFPDNSYQSLPKLLASMGYNTMAIHAEKPAYWNWARALKAIGVKNCIDYFSFQQDEKIGLGLSDRSFLNQTAELLKLQKQPFSASMLTLTNHSPFTMPDQYKKLVLGKEVKGNILGDYFQTVHYFDEQIGTFMSKLDTSGILDNSVIVIYGDHEGVHRYYKNEIKSLQIPGDWWKNNDHRVPLIIYQKVLQGMELKTIGGQVDILPTVTYLLGVNEKEIQDSAFGRNLLKTNKSFAVLADKKYIGNGTNEKDVEEAIKGIDLSDLVVSSNYFQETLKK